MQTHNIFALISIELHSDSNSKIELTKNMGGSQAPIKNRVKMVEVG